MVLANNESIAGQYWLWRDQKIYFVKAGASSQRPPLLLVHGFGASTDHWRKNISDLSQDFEVYAIDLLGFGRSQKPAWQYSGDLWRDQLHDFISAQIQRPTIIAGNSLGGYASLCVAADHPQSVAGVVLLNSAGPFTDTSPLGAQKVNPVQKAISKTLQGVLRQPWANQLLFAFVRQKSRIRSTLQKVYLDQSAVTDQLVEEIYRPSCDEGAAQVFASVFSTPQGKKVDQLLTSMTCPLLVIWGEGDPWMNSRVRGAKFREFYPSLTEHYINAGHCPHDECPEIVDGLIRDYFL
ncbi:MAG: alpha/beta fold hydrolase [Pseudanabaena sp.]|jgi:pimeloyl-ACP methyl ester carboxylesterase|uniref:alpha/beta fold hydrolase n=1 Tax=Pseudanabaena mucicola TaxID=71190 RepID=UPI0025749C27|nr:alpha/beta fold hydrolase [Pseudanabaena mucicola]MCA6586977.1 alpha/beta fold hydrolase [Pseudanabaena sp. M051S1SP1A06QC]MCA6588818.1 alpha/beta fold hydrolase [Pseudanabaena sp. M109S1SP1A06QC]MCA6612339.1 alpha/beta fold hydrolase [Pseudanabaena sp. M158S2SP1A06QC]MCA6616252.1 alpha/beta fold hydrolase [Pseudanabaena sp. M090S1SP1A06QC]MCA6624535.1 alpha/beta fold hydrolase [Pseudanabaena sp. M165S2SP1A06QC]MCE2976935.1 alpha/beta fold hydrolase [Pseudanabaena sp. CoA8_M7]